MIGLLLPLWLNLGGGSAPPAPTVIARCRQAFAPVNDVEQTFETVYRVQQVVESVHIVEQEFE